MAVWDDVLTGLDRQVYEQFRGNKDLGNRPALVVVDVNYAFTGVRPEPILDSIKTFLTSCGDRAWKVIPRLQALIQAARHAGMPVVYSTGIDREVRGAGWANRARKTGLLEPLNASELEKRKLGNRIVREIEPQTGDTVIRKIGPSVFFGTPLATLLNERDIDTVIVTGTTTSGCVRATAVDAACLDFYVGIVEDCTFDRFEISHKVSLMDMHAKYGRVISMADALSYFEATTASAQSGKVPTTTRA